MACRTGQIIDRGPRTLLVLGVHGGATPDQETEVPAAASAPTASGVSKSATMTLPSEPEAGSVGMQPGRGISWRAHRDDAFKSRATLTLHLENLALPHQLSVLR